MANNKNTNYVYLREGGYIMAAPPPPPPPPTSTSTSNQTSSIAGVNNIHGNYPPPANSQ